MAIASWGGVALAKRCGLPYQVSFRLAWKSLIKYASFGIVIGLVLLLIDYGFHLLGVSLTFFTASLPVWWKGLLASFYGGWGEELLLRFFLVALFSRLLMYLSGQKLIASQWIKLVSVLAAAFFFAIGHLPAASAMTDLTTIVILRVIILNSVGGIAFGLIYLKKGFLPAVVTHFFADLILQVMVPIMI
ncbi:MAG: hypothetical protein C0593_12575 [Marinilabiliales bacterium]|nr:MAG: hypothetical protein C0593_12575 [Marinilabiliales bacterium]